LGLVGTALAPLMRANEVASLQRADRVTVLTQEMGTALRSMGLKRPVDVVPLWATVVADPTVWEEARSAPTVQYSGNFGEKQGVTALLDLGRAMLAAAPDARLVLRGEGPRFEQLRTEAGRAANVDFESPVSEAHLPRALGRSSVHVVIQAPDSAPYAMPSKVVNALACGCHVVAMAEPTSPLARLAREIKELEVVAISDMQTMCARVVAQLRRTDGDGWRRAGSNAALQHFSRTGVLRQLERTLEGGAT
jgi:colanic acid biosynthesis glycosyl transferase WcaI